MGSLDKVVLWLPYMILPLEASRFLAILGQKPLFNGYFFDFFKFWGGNGASRHRRCAPDGASHRFRL